MDLTSSVRCLTSHFGTDQRLIQREELSPTHSVLGGERRERILHSAALFVFPLLCRSSVLSLPRQRAGLFLRLTEQLMCNGDVCSGCPLGMAAIWKQAAGFRQASAHLVYGFAAWIKHPLEMACNDSLLLKPIAKSRFPTPLALRPAVPPHPHPRKLTSPRSEVHRRGEWVC